MIKETIKTSFKYYDTGENRDIESIKNLFSEDEYERIKEDIARIRKDREIWEDEICKVPSKIPEIKFSQPRKYRDLKNRVGIMSLVDIISPSFTGGGCAGDQFHIFIFKQVDGDWKIEKIREVYTILDREEEILIEVLSGEIKNGS